jgi:transketolase
MVAAETLSDRGIEARVLDMHTIKPLDHAALESAARETGALVVAEEHLHYGGLGSAVALSLALHAPAPIEVVNLGDRYAESGKPDDLMRKYELTADAIVNAAERVLART